MILKPLKPKTTNPILAHLFAACQAYALKNNIKIVLFAKRIHFLSGRTKFAQVSTIKDLPKGLETAHFYKDNPNQLALNNSLIAFLHQFYKKHPNIYYAYVRCPNEPIVSITIIL